MNTTSDAQIAYIDAAIGRKVTKADLLEANDNLVSINAYLESALAVAREDLAHQKALADRERLVANKYATSAKDTAELLGMAADDSRVWENRFRAEKRSHKFTIDGYWTDVAALSERRRIAQVYALIGWATSVVLGVGVLLLV